MAGDSGGGTQRVINETKPDPALSAMRNKLMGYGDQLMKQGVPGYYPSNTVVPFSNQTQGGLDYLQNYAQQGAPNLQAANDASSRALSGWNPAMPFAMNAAAGGLSGNPATQALQGFGGASNPYLDGLFNQGAEKVTNAVNANFAQAGRFGANAAHTGALTEGLGNLYSSIYAPAYEAERNRGLSAAQTMGGLYDSGANRTLAGADLLAGTYSQGNQDAARQQALLPGLYQYGMMPGQGMLDIGSMYEGQAQNYLNEDRARYDYNANAPWDYLGNYAQLMSGMPDFSGSSSTTQGPGTNRVMSALGGGIAGMGAAQALGLSSPWGWALGGLGALGGLFG